MDHHHFLLVSLSFQSHINPTLRLATKLIRAGARVSFATTVSGLNNLKTRPSLPGLSYDCFSDGNDTEPDANVRKPGYVQEIELIGSINLKNLLLSKAKQGEKVDFLIYGMCIPWVAKVARELHLPSAFFFFQSAASFSVVVYQFFKGDGGMVNSDIDPNGLLQIPGLPLLRHGEIPQFLRPTEASFPVFREHIETLEKHPNPCILLNTFDGLEEESIKPIRDHINIFSVAPLIPGETEEPFICDIFQDSDRETYLRWLDSKPAKSVIYVSFGSIVELGKKQKEEILEGLIEAGYPFLWVIRNHGEDDEVAKSYRAEAATADGNGLIVRWCSQVEVLNHFAIGCFVSHCGWNSISESMVGGVAVVGCPQFSDQMMNMKMVEEVWGNGVKAVADGDGVVGREGIKRCLKVAMESEEIKRNCERLKAIAMEAVVDGGSSHTNLKRLFESFKCNS
ncbi:crocetin glucosyltransferase, chloroplastic-like [Cynara cardunculus var. scolymus]|uniref:UDP-glucuronosyl/UDP-glucosyltransferase n=1 Tax=Cynara cardunculus var. scolymus TaxID=59895 RepID=A0A118JZT5_CYNCS|nr:crocetin glucosyltransferase, chloroplastic-like [Cynara cardunculus var. scolymus]KVI00363.1 UDP-glucuronosyl/UDP-glucosyltransferase [Cynara cardunculus var. scolymus]